MTGSGDGPPRERIVRTDHWRAAHAFDAGLPGWLVLMPVRHRLAIADLGADEAAELGPLLRALSHALHKVVGCAKTYVMQFSEAEGFAHLHFHVVPRMPDQSDELRGPHVFALLGRPPDERVTTEEMDRLAVRLNAALDPRWRGPNPP